MAKTPHTPAKLIFRPARPDDARQTARLIFETFPKMATYLIGLGDARRAKKLLTEIFADAGHRFSYQFTELVCQGGKVVGMFIAFPGRGLTQKDWRLPRVLLKHYTFSEKLKLILRSLPLIFIKEAAADEYLLSNLAVRKGQRSQGIGAQILKLVEAQALQADYHKLALMVDIDNPDARRFYEEHGFKVKALHLEADKRVKHLGPGYQRMVKELTT